MEDLEVNEFWKGKRVFVTGHTGFKGSWLSFWLRWLGAGVYGFSLEGEESSLYRALRLEEDVNHTLGDVRDGVQLKNLIAEIQPDVVFHLAAQSLVRRSYREPLHTWGTNVIGTVNLLEGLRYLNHKCSVIVVTTDKVYENIEQSYAYKEIDKLGGHDPYSSSKAAAELAVSSWRRSFFNNNVRIATARAGNVIGGGDWSEDRIIPDLVRAIKNKQNVPVRNPRSVRPWQHVLEPLSGYMLLAKLLYEKPSKELQSAFNFGPNHENFRSVEEVVEEALKYWPGGWECVSKDDSLHEANLLSLSTEKASKKLSWHGKWNFEISIRQTIEWYRKVEEGDCPQKLTLSQIQHYSQE